MFLGIPQNRLSRCEKEQRNLYIFFIAKSHHCKQSSVPPGCSCFICYEHRIKWNFGNLNPTPVPPCSPVNTETKICRMLSPGTLNFCTNRQFSFEICRCTLGQQWAESCLCISGLSQSRWVGFKEWIIWKLKYPSNLNIALEMKSQAFILLHPESLFYLLPNGEWEGSHPSNFNLIRFLLWASLSKYLVVTFKYTKAISSKS